MSTDLSFAIGVVLLMLSLPSFVSAFSESRPPRMGALMVIFGAALVAMALVQKPGGYSFGDIPAVFARIWNAYVG